MHDSRNSHDYSLLAAGRTVAFLRPLSRVHHLFRAPRRCSPTLRGAAGLRDRRAFQTTSSFPPTNGPCTEVYLLYPRRSPLLSFPLLSARYTRGKRSTGDRETRRRATSKRADGTRARGRRDDRRMLRCTPVRPLPSLSLSLSRRSLLLRSFSRRCVYAVLVGAPVIPLRVAQPRAIATRLRWYRRYQDGGGRSDETTRDNGGDLFSWLAGRFHPVVLTSSLLVGSSSSFSLTARRAVKR